MSDILTITDFILSNAENISTVLIAAALVAAFVVGFAEYKSKLWEYITNRRNKWWFVYAAITLAAILFLRVRLWLTGQWLIGASVLWIVYIAAFLVSLRPKHFGEYTYPTFRRYEKWICDGSAVEHVDFFRKHHWYLWTAEDRLEFHMLATSYFADVKEFDKAYQALNEIKDGWLYESEKEIMKLQRAMLLAQMGSMKAAYQILGDPEKNTSGDPMVWFAYSFIYENAGDIDRALQYAEKSRNIVEAGYKAPDSVIAEVYNNYARVAIFKGNRQEALRYLDIAWNKVKSSKDMRTIHIVASNRIVQMAMQGKSQMECESALKEYKSLIPNDSFMNKVEYNNCEITYYRHIKDSKRENTLIKAGFEEVFDHLNNSQKVLYTASTFRMLINGHFEHKWFDKFVQLCSEEYDKLPPMDKLAAYREYMGFFQQEEFRSLCNRQPYQALLERIMKYYREQAIADVDAMLATVVPNDHFKYLNLMTMKLGILKHLEGKSHVKKSKDIYVDLYKELYDAGLHLDAIRILMTLVDECTSPYNVLIWRPSWPGAMYYCDYIAGSPPVPQPSLDPDGIHVHYYRLHIPDPVVIQPLHEDVIREHIDTIIAAFRSWKNHPFKVELSIEIAHILMCLDRREEAGEFLQFFKDSNVSELQMASWARQDIAALELELQGKPGQSERQKPHS